MSLFNRLSLASLLFWPCALGATVETQGTSSVQPIVLTVEQLPSRRSAGIVSIPEGSPWCDGYPTAWFPGHKNFLEDRPSCFVNGTWSQHSPHGNAVLDVIDDLNAIDNPTVIDRHDCGVLDINGDGLLDVYCMVGANKGTGYGFNELYLTQKGGFLFKIRRHALHTFMSLRTRHTTTLKGVDGTDLVFLSASHGAREDGQVNKHSMFRRNGIFTEDWHNRYFNYVDGPWHQHSRDNCALPIDANGDGIDDLLMCTGGGGAWLFIQNADGSFTDHSFDRTEYPVTANWRNARVADLTGDGIPDLAAVYEGEQDSRLLVFKGTKIRPYYTFDRPYYSLSLPFAAPDLEIIDVNGDGKNDIYVVQADEAIIGDNDRVQTGKEKFCAGTFDPSVWWTVNETSWQTPPDEWIPPPDTAHDLLLLGADQLSEENDARFTQVVMEHELPGCGYYVKKFTNSSLLLAQGGFDRPGHQTHLYWE